MIDKFFTLCLGVASVFLGIMIIIHPKFYHELSGQTIDVSGFNVPLGCALIVCGTMIIYRELTKHDK